MARPDIIQLQNLKNMLSGLDDAVKSPSREAIELAHAALTHELGALNDQKNAIAANNEGRLALDQPSKSAAYYAKVIARGREGREQEVREDAAGALDDKLKKLGVPEHTSAGIALKLSEITLTERVR